jgi:hypothetical protein
MTEHDPVRDLADRIEERRRRGENWEAEFEIEFGSLTTEEQDEFQALMDQRIAQGAEVLEAVSENVRILQLLFAYKEGAITAMECVERIRGVVTDLSAHRDPPGS